VQAALKSLIDFQLLSPAIRPIGKWRTPIGWPWPGRFLDDDCLAINAGKEQAASFTLPPSRLPVADQMLNNGVSQHDRLA